MERVDPDGDGDLHVVVSDRRGVTLRGLTAVDVSKQLRPRRDPRVGERAAAMGPVQTRLVRAVADPRAGVPHAPLT